mmetsp:Transcript_83991/g.151567  ORF Transcript_83991/g.151567 Transcript_83991/m.151567 type:complete len:227 (-) Transcript_83991:558-1238(-)
MASGIAHRVHRAVSWRGLCRAFSIAQRTICRPKPCIRYLPGTATRRMLMARRGGPQNLYTMNPSNSRCPSELLPSAAPFGAADGLEANTPSRDPDQPSRSSSRDSWKCSRYSGSMASASAASSGLVLRSFRRRSPMTSPTSTGGSWSGTNKAPGKGASCDEAARRNLAETPSACRRPEASESSQPPSSTSRPPLKARRAAQAPPRPLRQDSSTQITCGADASAAAN